jgi:hypothetical protein
MKYWEETIFDNFARLKRGYDLSEKNIYIKEGNLRLRNPKLGMARKEPKVNQRPLD